MNNERLRRERVEEMRERELRRKNVVLHRVDEAGDWAKTAEERREWDAKSIENIFRALKNEDGPEQESGQVLPQSGRKG